MSGRFLHAITNVKPSSLVLRKVTSTTKTTKDYTEFIKYNKLILYLSTADLSGTNVQNWEISNIHMYSNTLPKNTIFDDICFITNSTPDFRFVQISQSPRKNLGDCSTMETRDQRTMTKIFMPTEESKRPKIPFLSSISEKKNNN